MPLTRPDSPPFHRRIAVLGAGPIGLEAALQGVRRGHEVAIYEAGSVGDAIRRWGHVKLFSPWSMNRSGTGAAALEGRGPAPDPDLCPTGREYVQTYLEPLADLPELRDRIHTGCRVLGVSRQGLLKSDRIGDPARAAAEFRILLEEGGSERVVTADVVLDATGIYDQPNATGDGGIPAPGEAAAEAAGRLRRHLEDYEDAVVSDYAGQAILVVGGGYSAATAVRSLCRLADRGTRVTWVVRATGGQPIASIPDDPLLERVTLTVAANRAAESGAVRLRPGRVVEAVTPEGDALRVRLRSLTGEPDEEERSDRVVSLTGYGPDRSLWRELQVHECWATAGPMGLAAALLASSGEDCLAPSPAGADSLRSPEPDLFILGSKSYGRNPTFLLRNGWDQVRDVFRLLEEEPVLAE